MSERKSFGRVKGQTKSQSIISDDLISPYIIQIDDYIIINEHISWDGSIEYEAKSWNKTN